MRNALSKEWLDKIATAIKKVKENPSKFHFTIQEAGENDGVFFMDYCNWTRIPELKVRKIFRNEDVVVIVVVVVAVLVVAVVVETVIVVIVVRDVPLGLLPIVCNFD